MDNCLEKYKYPKLSGKEQNQNRPITVIEVQSAIGLFSQEKYSTSPVIRECQLKWVMQFHKNNQLTKKKISDSTKSGQRRGERVTSRHWLGVQTEAGALE